MIDLVYIVKEDERNEDLRYSLRSVAKFLPNNKIWIVGYKPSWIRNVNYIPVKQTEDKWKNSVKNILEACKCNEISEDFVLMNDDFFAIKPIKDLKKSINLCLGNLDLSIQKYKNPKTDWEKAFLDVYELLESLDIEKPYYDFESHTPLLLNRKKYLETMSLSKVVEFMNTNKVLHKRTLYKNVIKDSSKISILSQDVKVLSKEDTTEIKSNLCDWLSVGDNLIGKPRFSKLTKFLSNLFPEPCIYETKIKHVIPVKKPVKKHNFIYY